MVKMMPSKWIEQAEARQVCVMAVSENVPMPDPPRPVSSLRSSLVRLRFWIWRSGHDREGEQQTAPLSSGVVRLRRARRAAG